jgi:hypothetical protein
VLPHREPLQRDRDWLLCVDDEVQVTQTVDLQRAELVIYPGCHVAGTSFRILARPSQLRAEDLFPIVHLHHRARRGLKIKFDETCDDPPEIHREVVHLSGRDVEADGQLRRVGTDDVL